MVLRRSRKGEKDTLNNYTIKIKWINSFSGTTGDKERG